MRELGTCAERLAVGLIQDIVNSHFPAPAVGRAEDGSPILHWNQGDVSMKVRVWSHGALEYERCVRIRDKDGQVTGAETCCGCIDGPDAADFLMVCFYEPLAKEA